MVWTTRYIGVISYALVSALLIAKDVVTDIQGAVMLLAPIAIFIGADQIKHRNDESFEEMIDGKISPDEYISIAEISSSQINS